MRPPLLVFPLLNTECRILCDRSLPLSSGASLHRAPLASPVGFGKPPLVMGLGAVGLWSLARGLLRRVRSASPDGDRRIGVERARGRVEPAAIREPSEALDVANRRLDRIEAKAEFDRRLAQGRWAQRSGRPIPPPHS